MRDFFLNTLALKLILVFLLFLWTCLHYQVTNKFWTKANCRPLFEMLTTCKVAPSVCSGFSIAGQNVQPGFLTMGKTQMKKRTWKIPPSRFCKPAIES